MTIGQLNMEQDLVHRLKSGEEEAFAMLYDNYGSLLFGTIVRIVDDKKEAENLLQDCFVKIWQNIFRYDSEKSKLATWLISVARNTAIDFTRSKYFSQRQKNQNLDVLVFSETGKSVQPLLVETLGIRQLVEKLTPTCREIIEWMYFDGYTQQEIADNFNIPLGTVKSRTRLALKELRAYYVV